MIWRSHIWQEPAAATWQQDLEWTQDSSHSHRLSWGICWLKGWVVGLFDHVLIIAWFGSWWVCCLACWLARVTESKCGAHGGKRPWCSSAGDCMFARACTDGLSAHANQESTHVLLVRKRSKEARKRGREAGQRKKAKQQRNTTTHVRTLTPDVRGSQERKHVRSKTAK